LPNASGNSHTGRRERNEDAYCVMPHLGLFAVADGMGGHEGGEVASHLVVSTLVDFFEREAEQSARAPRPPAKGCAPATRPPRGDAPEASHDEGRLDLAIRRAHERVIERASGPLRRMGSTLAALLLRERRVVVAHVGDSRVYRLREGALERLTTDHSLCAELEALGGRKVDRFLREQIGHLITRCIAAQGPAHADVRVDDAQRGDVYLLCSDGLTDVLSDAEIAQTLTANEAPEEASRALVEWAYRRGGTDNITAVVVRVER
jgi:serine/threonine protein phosphatase PrpC